MGGIRIIQVLFDNNFFRMRRGTDESNIESMGEAAEVIKIDKSLSSFIEIDE